MKLFGTVLVCALLACCAIRADAQWRRLDTNLEAPVTRLLSRDTNLLASTYGNGMFRSVDNGKTWQDVNTGLVNRNINDFYGYAQAGTTDVEVCAATDGDGVACRVIGKDATWRVLNTGLSDRYVRSIVHGLYALSFASANQDAQSRLYRSGPAWQEYERKISDLRMERMFITFPVVYIACAGELYVTFGAS